MAHFLLTYSVHAQYPNIPSDAEKADKVRNDIAKIDDVNWDKLKDVETTFSGNIDLIGEIEYKRRKVKLEVTNRFVEILKEHKSGPQDVIIHCALMVDGLGQSIVFNVTNG
jgi:hypothetical protein